MVKSYFYKFLTFVRNGSANNVEISHSATAPFRNNSLPSTNTETRYHSGGAK